MSSLEPSNAAAATDEITPPSLGPLKRLWGAVELVHAFPVAIVVVMSVVFLLIVHRGSPGLGFLLRAGLTVLMTQIATGALNDLLDRHHDAMYQREKPIPSGRASERTARLMIVLSLLFLIPLSLSFGPASLLVIAIATSGGVLYDLWLKPTPFSVAGYAIGFLGLFTWIWLIAGHLTYRFFLAIPLGVLILATAHLAQSFPDVEADRADGLHGLAVALGPRGTYWTIIISYGVVVSALLSAAVAVTSPWALASAVAAVVLGSAALAAGRRSWHEASDPPDSRVSRARKLLFFLIAPGLGSLAIGVMLLIT